MNLVGASPPQRISYPSVVAFADKLSVAKPAEVFTTYVRGTFSTPDQFSAMFFDTAGNIHEYPLGRIHPKNINFITRNHTGAFRNGWIAFGPTGLEHLHVRVYQLPVYNTASNEEWIEAAQDDTHKQPVLGEYLNNKFYALCALKGREMHILPIPLSELSESALTSKQERNSNVHPLWTLSMTLSLDGFVQREIERRWQLR